MILAIGGAPKVQLVLGRSHGLLIFSLALEAS
jgi:hypothetical protein